MGLLLRSRSRRLLAVNVGVLVPSKPYLKIATVRTVDLLRDHLERTGLRLPCDSSVLTAPDSPLADSYVLTESAFPAGFRIGNRFAIQPMEGWDGTADGHPTERTARRWAHFGESGAKMIWGCEAVAVRPDGRANPNQLMLYELAHRDSIAGLLRTLVDSHRRLNGTTDNLLIGLQLTHSGRFSRPNDQRLEPRILYRHPLLDRRFRLADDTPVMTDGEIRGLIAEYVRAAKWAAEIGFHFVDLKHCHGYLGHEFLSAVTRDGDYGGSLANRTRFLREIVEGVRSEAPHLAIGVRVSAFDFVPFEPDPDQSRPGRPGPGIPCSHSHLLPYHWAFGANPENPTEVDLAETYELLAIFRELGIRLVNTTAGSPYTNPHIQRPAYYPPSDGYEPPEDPLAGVERQIAVTRRLRERFPEIVFVGTAYTYLQQYLPQVAQAAVREGWVDFVGLGRMVLSYPRLPADILMGRQLDRRRICRTFSDCTTAPRKGLPSGCYPLDDFYKISADADRLKQYKQDERDKPS